MITATHKASRAGDHRYEPSLHLTGCWLPLDSDAGLFADLQETAP